MWNHITNKNIHPEINVEEMKKQKKIKTHKKNMMSKDSPLAKTYTEAVAHMMVLDLQPYSLV